MSSSLSSTSQSRGVSRGPSTVSSPGSVISSSKRSLGGSSSQSLRGGSSLSKVSSGGLSGTTADESAEVSRQSDSDASSADGDEGLLDAPDDARIFKVEEAELQNYLTTMRLDKLFAELVEELLVDAPSNPVKFMIDFLFTQFPDQAQASSFAKTFPDGTSAIGGGIPLTGLHAAAARAMRAESSDDDEMEEKAERKRKKDEARAVKAALVAAEAKTQSKAPAKNKKRNSSEDHGAHAPESDTSELETDEDDEEPRLIRKPGSPVEGTPAQQLKRNVREAAARSQAVRQRIRVPIRRKAVCGMALGVGEPEVDLRDGTASRKGARALYTPSPAELVALRRALQGSLFFGQLLRHELEAVLGCCDVVGHLGGDILWGQGARGSDAVACYIVLEGQVELRVDGRRISLKGPGEVVGEQAMILDMARNTSCAVVGPSSAKLGAILRPLYQAAIEKAARMFREQAVGTLRNIPYFSATLSELEILKLAEEVCKVETFARDQYLFKQHQPGESMYIVLSGKVRCEQCLSPSEPNVCVEIFEVGDWFGEVALITDRPRAAACLVDSDELQVLTIERGAFTRTFGPLTDLLRRNHALFKRFISDKI
jgi:CRP-like cAMP-binding protein